VSRTACAQRSLDPVAGEEGVADGRRAALLGEAGERRQAGGDAILARDRLRVGADEAARLLLLGEPEGRLQPARQRVGEEGPVARGRRREGVFEAGAERAGVHRPRPGRPAQGLPDHVLRLYRGAEEEGGYACHLRPLLLDRARAGERGRGADALQVARLRRLAQPAAEQGHVRSLTAAVGVELIEDEEAKAPGRLHQLALEGAGEDQLEHGVVGEQDVGLLVGNALALLVGFLAGVAGEGDRGTALRVAQTEELLQLAELAVRQRVHGVDDDRLDALARAPAQHVVDDGDDVGEALARAGAGGEHVVDAACGGADGFLLVAVEAQGLSVRVARGLVAAEDAGALGLEDALGDEPVDGLAGLEGRVELDEGVGPEKPGLQLLLHHPAEALVADVDEGARVVRMLTKARV